MKMVGATAIALAKPTPPSSTYEWLRTIPMAASAGGVMFCLYEGSKNYNSVTQYALETVESSVKKAACTVAPMVQKLNKPIQVVDSYAAGKLVNLGAKVPALKCEPREVVTYLSEGRKNLAIKITESQTAISTSLLNGKKVVTGRFYSCKEALCSKISAVSEAISNSRVSVLVGEVKEAVSIRFVQGKETLGSGVTAGQNAIQSRIQSGAECLANTRAGVMIGAGIDYTLEATECWVKYHIPELDNEMELFFEQEGKRKSGFPVSVTDADLEEEVNDSPVKCEMNRVEHACVIFRKIKLRICYRFMQRLQAMQHYCKTTLQQLKGNVDLAKLAYTAHNGLDKQYWSATGALKDLEYRVRQLLSRQIASREKGVSWLPKDEEEDNRLEWLTPGPQGTLQVSLDYAKRFGKNVFLMFQSVTVATVYLPKQLRNGTGQSCQYAQEMCSTVKPIQTSMDLYASAQKKTTSILKIQLGYATQLGTFFSSFLQERVTSESFIEELDNGQVDTFELDESTDEDYLAEN